MEPEQRKFVGIKVGDTFSCYGDLKDTIERVQMESEVYLYMRDCVTLKGAMKKRPNVAMMANPILLYHSIQYICLFGRKPYTKGSKDILPEMLSKDGEKCKSEIRIGLSEDYQLLRVKKIVDTHNHVISKKIYGLVAQHRNFDFTPRHNFTSRKPIGPRKRRANKSRIPPKHTESQDNKSNRTESPVAEKLSISETRAQSSKQLPPKRKLPERSKENARKKIKIVQETTTPSPQCSGAKHEKCDDAFTDSKPKFKKRVEFKKLLEEMYQVDRSTVEVYEEGLKPQAIYFQTEKMRSDFASYPDVLLIDASYKIVDLGMTLYVVMNADGNGECTIAAFWFLMKENPKNLTFLLEKFEKHNPDCHEVKLVMLDTEFPEKNILRERFDNAVTFICYHHAVRAFKKEAYAKTDIGFQNEDERDTCMKLFKKMALAKDQDSYLFHFERFKLYSPASLFKYFLTNWHKIPSQWVDGLKDPNACFLNQRHSRLDAINQIVKSVCDNFKSVPRFFHDLMKSVSSLRLERKQRALLVPVKGPVITSEFHIAEMQYRNLLTPYAFSLVKKQLHSSSDVTIQQSMSEDRYLVKCAKYTGLETGTTTCHCTLYCVTGLPCSHVFAARMDKGLPTYEASLCHSRWTLHCLRRTHNLPGGDSDLVPDALFGYGETSQPTSPAEEESLSETGNAPFVPSCASSDTRSNDQNLEEDSVVDEGIDTDFLLPFHLHEEAEKSDKKDNNIPDIDWVGLLETL